MARLDCKVAVVTGGANGIGLAIAQGYAAEGAVVCIADISQERCDIVAREIGKKAFGHVLDVRNQQSIDALMDHVSSQAGGIDILVNCAGLFSAQSFLDITEQEFDRLFAVNTRGLLFMVQAGARRMIEQKRGGAIINFASAAGRRPSPGAAIYSASKAAVISITQAAALEFARYGIRVNAVSPGVVQTAMWKQVEEQLPQVLGVGSGGMEPLLVSATPMGRLSMPDEYVGPVVFLASPEASYITGQTVNIDGGLYMN